MREFVDEVVTVPDADMMRAIAWLFRHARLVVEPSGAVTIAAVMLGLGGIDPSRGPVVAIVSGGNVEPEKVRVVHSGWGGCASIGVLVALNTVWFGSIRSP